MMFRLPPVTERMYPPLRAAVTWMVIEPEAVPLTARSPTTQYPPATLVRVMVSPVESLRLCEFMYAEC